MRLCFILGLAKHLKASVLTLVCFILGELSLALAFALLPAKEISVPGSAAPSRCIPDSGYCLLKKSTKWERIGNGGDLMLIIFEQIPTFGLF